MNFEIGNILGMVSGGLGALNPALGAFGGAVSGAFKEGPEKEGSPSEGSNPAHGGQLSPDLIQSLLGGLGGK